MMTKERAQQIARYPLEKQCEALEIPINKLSGLKFRGKKGAAETATVAHYEKAGFDCRYDEYGTLTNSLIRAASLDYLFNLQLEMLEEYEEHSPFYGPEAFKYPGSQLVEEYAKTISNRDLFNPYFDAIANATIETVYRNLVVLWSITCVEKRDFGSTNKDESFLLNLFKAVGPERLKLLEMDSIKAIRDKSRARGGWPDLTLLKDGELHLVEVKTTDKLHTSQIYTFPELNQIFPGRVSVTQLASAVYCCGIPRARLVLDLMDRSDAFPPQRICINGPVTKCVGNDLSRLSSKLLFNPE